MLLTGKQKAAMLLMSLDAASATELLQGVDTELVQELAMELAYMDSAGLCNKKEQGNVVQEFYSSLGKNQGHSLNIGPFFNEILAGILGSEKAMEIRSQVKKTTARKDLFINIRLASVDELVVALESEHPQAIALVLSELDTKKSQEILSLLNEDTRLKTVWRMTTPDSLASEVKQRIASVFGKRLESLKGAAFVAKPGKREENLRKLAIMLSGLEKDLRDQLLDEIVKHDEETGKAVRLLMITWEDISTIADRSMQETLRTVDSSKLAIALYGADGDIMQKIRSNISERVGVMVDEEIKLMQEPLEKEILDAREEVIKPLREANEEGKLRMVGR